MKQTKARKINDDVPNAGVFDNDAKAFTIETVESASARNISGNLTARLGSNENIKSQNQGTQNSVNLQKMLPQIPHTTDSGLPHQKLPGNRPTIIEYTSGNYYDCTHWWRRQRMLLCL